MLDYTVSVNATPDFRLSRNRLTPAISVVIPAKNEAANLPAVFARLPPDLFEVILVDGRSTDGTVEVARQLLPSVRVLEQEGHGKGNALAMGFAAVRGEIVVMLDADGSADAAEIPRYVAALVAGADFVKGSRFAQGGGSTDITWIRRLGNRALCGLVNRIYGMSYTDLCYGYNAFWTDCLLPLQVTWPGSPLTTGAATPFGMGFEVETTMNIRAAKAALIVWEVPSFERPRIFGQSNLSAIRDGTRILRAIWHESPGRALRQGRQALASAASETSIQLQPAQPSAHGDHIPQLNGQNRNRVNVNGDPLHGNDQTGNGNGALVTPALNGLGS
jgi:hypothetical protein